MNAFDGASSHIVTRIAKLRYHKTRSTILNTHTAIYITTVTNANIVSLLL
jgi:hypothetical protein